MAEFAAAAATAAAPAGETGTPKNNMPPTPPSAAAATAPAATPAATAPAAAPSSECVALDDVPLATDPIPSRQVDVLSPDFFSLPAPVAASTATATTIVVSPATAAAAPVPSSSFSATAESSDESTDVGSECGTDSENDEEAATHANFYDWREIYGDVPELAQLRENWHTVRDECARLDNWIPWPEQNLYDGKGEEWKVLPFVHTFPGNDPSASQWMDRFCEMCPRTSAMLRRLPGLRTALLSRMGPQTRLSAHRGWADLANHVLRVHLALDIPGEDGDHTCGLWVRGEKRYHRNGELIVFDDSKLHKAFNNHPTQRRSVLIFDLARPEGLPRGTARKGHTDQLDGFIAHFR